MVDHNGVALGPYSLEDLRTKVRRNELSPTDRACDQQGGIWLPVSKVLAGYTGGMAVITSRKIDAATIFASIRRGLFRK
jgi:hypothetical protein